MNKKEIVKMVCARIKYNEGRMSAHFDYSINCQECKTSFEALKDAGKNLVRDEENAFIDNLLDEILAD